MESSNKNPSSLSRWSKSCLIKIQSHKYSRSLCKYKSLRLYFKAQGGHWGRFLFGVIDLLEKLLMPKTFRQQHSRLWRDFSSMWQRWAMHRKQGVPTEQGSLVAYSMCLIVRLSLDFPYSWNFGDSFHGWHMIPGKPVSPPGILNLINKRSRKIQMEAWE